jgi:hypothetical protein
MRRLTLILLIATMVAALAGCNSSTKPAGTDLNKVQVSDLVSADESADPNLAGMNLADETDLSAADVQGMFGVLAAIPDTVKVCWFRHLSQTDKTVEVTGDSTLETATLTRTNVGALRGTDCTPHRGAHADTTPLFDKAYTVTWTRMAQFTKMPATSDAFEDGGHWKLVRTSLAHSTQSSPAVATPVIQSVTISGRDTLGLPISVVFTDPTAMFDPATLPWFAPGDTVNLKILTDNPANQLAFIHFDMASSDRGRCQRMPIRYVAADNAFEAVFPVMRPQHGGGHANGRRVRTAVWVDVMTKTTIRDTTEPYAATGWGIPYRLPRPHGMMAAR